jgi:Chalcone isomerase-like
MNRHSFLKISATALAAGSTWLHLPAFAQMTLSGVQFEQNITVGGQRLQLNGAGVRFRAIFRVYAAALYTPTKMTRDDEVLKPGVRRIHMVALRDVGGDQFGKLFTRAMEDNATREEFLKSINSVVRMGQIFADAKQFAKGDSIMLDFVPGTGMIVSHKGQQLGAAFKEPEFMNLLLKIWFGPKPVDEALRKALLGEQTTANTNVN